MRGRKTKEAATEYLVAGYVRGATSLVTIRHAVESGALGVGAGQKVCLVAAPGYQEGVEAFCANDYHYYFGDIDIINAYRAGLPMASSAACDLRPAERALSYEPYALLVPSRNAEFRARFVAAIYEIFTDGTAAGRFAHHFRGMEPSPALSLLYRINSIPSHREASGGASTQAQPNGPNSDARAGGSPQVDPEGGGGGEGGEGEDEEGEGGEEQEGGGGVAALGGG